MYIHFSDVEKKPTVDQAFKDVLKSLVVSGYISKLYFELIMLKAIWEFYLCLGLD